MKSFLEGRVILINKPYHWTSFDAVNKVKGIINKKARTEQCENGDERPERPKLKIGHAGTLDPLATGLLILCTGKFTKRIEEFQAQEKEYTGTFFIGATTPCFDMEQEVDAKYPTEHISPEMIYEAARNLTGSIQQIPPVFSAMKINGKRAYDLARKGLVPEMKPKTVVISVFEITRIELPYVDYKVVCSKGTYIRSLARDFGLALKSGAYVSALCRTRIGEFLVENALNIEAFEKLF
jgi:tRNA pseudouridine55 synthase